MEEIKDILAEILGRPDIKKGMDSSKPLIFWEKIVGERIASHTRPVKITKKVLFINTTSPVWAQQLSLMKMTLIQKINEYLGVENAIQDIRFSGKGVIHKTTENIEPGKKNDPALTKDELATVSCVVSEIKNDEIRSRIKNIIISDMKHKKAKAKER
jgi:hypothetical protein